MLNIYPLEFSIKGGRRQNMSEYIVGIDVGSSKVCAAMGKVDKLGYLHILGTASAKCYGVKKSTVTDIELTAEAIAKCKQQLETMTGTIVDEVYLSIPGGLCELEFTKGVVAVSSDDREIVNKDVERVLNAAKIISISSDKEIIGIIPYMYSVDGHDNITDPVGMSGIRLEVDAKIAIAESAVVSNLLKSMQVAGIKVIDIILQPFALSSLSLTQEEKSMSVAMVDIGADTIDLCIYKGGNICYTNLIPLGGNSITNDIAKCLRVSFAEAEDLKNTFGDVRLLDSTNNDSLVIKSEYDENLRIDKGLLIDIIKARAEELLTFVKEELIREGYYEGISTVLIAGGALSMFKGAADLSRTIIGKPAKIVSPAFSGISDPDCATAAGLVKWVYDRQKPARYTHKEAAIDLDEQSIGKINIKSNKLISKLRDIIDELF